jgi:hypothetical protein
MVMLSDRVGTKLFDAPLEANLVVAREALNKEDGRREIRADRCSDMRALAVLFEFEEEGAITAGF